MHRVDLWCITRLTRLTKTYVTLPVIIIAGHHFQIFLMCTCWQYVEEREKDVYAALLLMSLENAYLKSIVMHFISQFILHAVILLPEPHEIPLMLLLTLANPAQVIHCQTRNTNKKRTVELLRALKFGILVGPCTSRFCAEQVRKMSK